MTTADLTLAVDQGTTGTTVLVVTSGGRILGRGYREHPQHFPQPGWVEHDPAAIWKSALAATGEALANAGTSTATIAAVGITNQRETLVAWKASNGAAIGPAIVWQDRRTARRCEQLRSEGASAEVRGLTGLPIDPYFSATKIEWLLANDDDVRAAATSGDLRVGTIDSWLVHRMSGGDAHITDAGNAARTMLFDIHAGTWSEPLCERFGVDPGWLPSVVASSGEVARTNPGAFLGIDAPIAGIAGDQQSALFGQACVERGLAKATYGTGAFVLVNSGDEAPVTDALISTVAWRMGGRDTYALEGSVFTAGASVQWLRDGAQFVATAPEIEELAASVPDSGGVVLVPAFAGLGAPVWNADARAALMGITRGTTRAHIARATLEAIAYRVRQVIDAMRAEGTDVRELRVDGGMAANDLFLQLQADTLGIPVVRPRSVETTSLGAAYLAQLGSGIHPDVSAIASTWQAGRTFTPAPNATLERGYEVFVSAVSAVEAFAAGSVAAGGVPAPLD